MSPPTWVAEYQELVDDCEARESRLTDWERSFIDSIGKQLDAERLLTKEQIEKLEEIWDRATARG